MILNRGESLLNAAAEGGSQEIFNTVVKLFDGAVRIRCRNFFDSKMESRYIV